MNDDKQVTSEYGVIVYCWEEEEFEFYDCYVAFFGDAMPVGKPAEQPYLLRHAAMSLTTIP